MRDPRNDLPIWLWGAFRMLHVQAFYKTYIFSQESSSADTFKCIIIEEYEILVKNY